MTLKARVGRHATTGVQCQNWVDDQLTVIGLLNMIPAIDGGAEGKIPFDRVTAGIASDPLYKAILAFQKKQFPVPSSGFIEPGGPVLLRIEALAFRPSAAPTPTAPATPAGQWGEFKSGSVQRALYKALTNDHQLSHATVVDILYATLSNGTVSSSELDDLEMIAAKSRTMSPRSKKMLESFVGQARADRRLGPFFLVDREVGVAKYVCEFLKKSGHGQWPGIERDDIGTGILMRFAYPSLMDQGSANLCGPAAFLFQLAQDQPGTYATFAMDLYEKGHARLHGIVVSPSMFLRLARHSGVVAVDWLTMASLRDSENWFLTFDSTDDTLAGATTQFEMASWFTRAGYSDVTEDANLTRHQRDTDNMDKASQLYAGGYRVCLLIDYQMIEIEKQSKSGSAFGTDRHWVVLRSKIERSGGNVKMTIFTWGEGNRQVPRSGNLPLSDFLENYYGYVAGKP